MAKLGVNVDHVATLRQVRGGVRYPDPVTAASVAENAGADQITIHLREDRRHIQEVDLFTIRRVLKVPLNLELAANDEIVEIASKVRPDTCTFVPERREELTTEGGLDVIKSFDKLSRYIRTLKANSISISMFVEPEAGQVEASKEAGATAVELHTGRYCEMYKHGKASFAATNADTCSRRACSAEIDRLKIAAHRAKEIGLRVVAGHGLNYDNTSLIVREIPEIVEYNIGHSIIARAVFVGLAQAVAEMKKIVASG